MHQVQKLFMIIMEMTEVFPGYFTAMMNGVHRFPDFSIDDILKPRGWHYLVFNGFKNRSWKI